tara:strand:- start:1006 stop:1692 length:687 start_codon:yes stop_codon:yes gene_type:complete
MQARSDSSLFGLIEFWWSVASYLASSAQTGLGLWPIPAKPFLPRADHERLGGLVTFLEAILRRLLYLEAEDLGALPSRSLNGLIAVPTRSQPHQDAPPGTALGAEPRFRLMESTPRKAANPPPKQFRTGPRIRFLDEPAPVDLRDYPALPTDILPSGILIRRLRAINHALDHPGQYITRMRRLIGAAAPVLRTACPPVFRSRRLKHLQQESARDLHAVAMMAHAPDTS